MKAMDHHDNPVAKILAAIFGMIGGSITLLKIHLGFDPTLWGTIFDKVISVMGALIIAFLSGFVGYAGGILAKRVFKKK